MLATAPATRSARTRGRRSRAGGSTGPGARRSTATSATTAHAARARATTGPGRAQPPVPPSISPNDNAPSAITDSTSPAPSIGLPAVPGRCPLSRCEKSSASSAIGGLTRNTRRHPPAATSPPPMIGPVTRPMLVTAAQAPTIRDRCARSGYSAASRAREAGTSPAAAAPSSARPAMSRPMVGAAAHSSETTRKPASAARYTRRGPNRSAMEPEASRSPAKTTVYALTVQGSAAPDACRSRCRSGRATVSTDASSRTRKLPAATPRNGPAVPGRAGAGAVAETSMALAVPVMCPRLGLAGPSDQAASPMPPSERLGYAQSSLSAQLRSLEAELGAELVSRSNSGVSPTDAGRRLLPYAHEALTLHERMRRAVADARPRLRVGALETLADEWLPDILAAYQRGAAGPGSVAEG